jgi:hypothetical protein
LIANVEERGVSDIVRPLQNDKYKGQCYNTKGGNPKLPDEVVCKDVSIENEPKDHEKHGEAVSQINPGLFKYVRSAPYCISDAVVLEFCKWIHVPAKDNESLGE